MSKSKKPSDTSKEKGFLSLAGEAFSVLGHDIVEGKDKVVEVASEKITAIKEGVGHLLHPKKAVPKKASKKAAPKKAVPRKAAAKKPATAKKAASKKASSRPKTPVKKTAPKKATKKAAKKR